MKFLQYIAARRGPHRPEQKWICGHAVTGRPCRMGPDWRGQCQGTFECAPAKVGETWHCRRPASQGGMCPEGPRPDGTCCRAIPPCRPRRSLRAVRGAVSVWSAILAIGLLSLVLTYAGDADILIPGTLSAGHSPITQCSNCHTGIKQGSFAWLHALVSPSTTRDDTKACLTCHPITPAALQPHGQAVDQLEALTKRSLATAEAQQTPIPAAIRNMVFPTDSAFSDGVFCATCHKEHQGMTANLAAVSSERCHACHVVQFESFQNDHPQFTGYPYSRRTRINFDHASHFGEHFSKTRAKNDPAQPVPDTCADCHQTAADTKRMDVKPFEQVCSACHLHQIAGTERLSSHQGISFLALPGLDLDTLSERGAAPGAWPSRSDAKLSPFMALLIGRDEDSRAALNLIRRLDLRDLSEASDKEIAAVNWLAWEIKTLLHSLSTERPSETLQRLAEDGDAVDTDLLGRLTAHLPRDVISGAVREWLPDLDAELAAHQPIAPPKSGSVQTSADETFRTSISKITARLEQDTTVNEDADAGSDEESLEEDDASDILSDDELEEAENDTTEDDADEESDILDDEEDLEEDDEEEEAEAEEPAPRARSDLDAQSWAELGGWYRQDYAILYKPTGHADSFFKTWLDHAASLLGGANPNLSLQVFAALTDERAQGQCTKCHSIDADKGGNRTINWGPEAVLSMEGKFTTFAHEPHFSFADEKGCMTCHELDRTTPYQKGFEDHDPSTFASNFKPMRMDQCTTCHTANEAATTCLTCHEYHVNDVKTPVMNTEVPK